MKIDDFDKIKGAEFDKMVGEKLGGYREQPSPEVFARIERSIAGAAKVRKSSRRTLLYAARWSAAAAILAGLALGYSLLFDSGRSDSENIGENTAVVSVNDNSTGKSIADNDTPAENDLPATQQITGSAPEHESPSGAASTGQTGAVPSETPSMEVIPSGTLPYKTLTEELPGTGAQHNITPVAETPLLTGTANLTPVPNDSRRRDVSLSEDLIQPIDLYWEELLRREGEYADSKPRKGRSKRVLRGIEEWQNDNLRLQESAADKFSGTLYAGNFGAGNYTSSDSKDIIFNRMTIVERSGIENSGNSTTLYNPSHSAPSGAPAAPLKPKSELIHKMPVNFGLTVGFDITDRLAVISGLNYSYLNSQSSQWTGSADNADRLRREIHYIGIPLKFSYSIVGTKRFGFYVSGGGMLEKAVYAKETTIYGLDSGNTESSRNISVKGVSPSVNAALGLSVRFSRTMSLYLEPGVSYYFEQIDALPSYRTQHPVNFSLSAGIRFKI